MSTKADAGRNHRLSAESKFMDTLLTFVPTDLTFDAWKSKYSMKYSSVQELPPNVHLLTLEEWAGNSRDSVLLRLEHQVLNEPTNDKTFLSITVVAPKKYNSFVMKLNAFVLRPDLKRKPYRLAPPFSC